jgi:Carboxypeptidase regulatory-like domain/TonB dependent receptor-like, beta-barrel
MQLIISITPGSKEVKMYKMGRVSNLLSWGLWASVIFILFCAFNSPMMGQNAQVNGSFHGTITDSSGAVVPGAKIVAKNLSNAQVREATTDSRGFYIIGQLPPGNYSVTVTKEGFSASVQPSVQLLVNQDLELDYALKLGTVTQQIEVTAAPTMLQTASATLAHVIQSQQVTALPLNGRQFTQLILLTPGAAPREGGQQASLYVIKMGAGGISPSTNGQQGTQNVFTVDGIFDNNAFSQQWMISPPPDAIEEFNVQSHITDARFAISSGANVNLVTKSGGPKLHGDLWEFLRNSALDAPNYIDNALGNSKPPYRQNQYGLTVGGPVVLPHFDGRKNHTYFFGYWEGFRSSKGFTVNGNFPTAPQLNGDFSSQLTNQPTGQVDNLGRPILAGQIYDPYSTRDVTAGQLDPTSGLVATGTGLVRDPFQGNIIPPSMLTPEALTYLNAFYPAPNLNSTTGVNYVASSSRVITSDQFSIGIDHTFGNNDTLSGKFFYTVPDDIEPNALKLGATTVGNHARLLSLAYTHLFNPTLLASVHYGYLWSDIYNINQPAGLDLLNATNMAGFLPVQNNIPQVPRISMQNYSGTSQFAIPLGPMLDHEITADLEKTHGSHSISTGLLLFHVHNFDNGYGGQINFDQFPTTGIYGNDNNDTGTGNGLASMLLNLPSGFTGFFGRTYADMKTNWIGYYLQDKWQASKKLTVQYGIRWDYQAPPHYKDNLFTMWNSNCPMGSFTTPEQIHDVQEGCLLMPIPYTPLPTATNPNPLSWPVPNTRQTIWDPRYNGWQPRFGFSYAAKPNTVIHGAFAVFDDHNQFDMEMQDPRGSWPFGGNTSPSGFNRGIPSLFFNNMPSAASFLASATTVVIGRAADPQLKIPYAMQWNLGFQQQLTSRMTLTVNYVGSGSRHLWGNTDYNQALLGNLGPNTFPNGLPFPFIGGTIQDNVNFFTSNYDSLQASLQRRVARNLSFLGSYTWSKCLDEFSGQYASHPQNTYDVAADYGPCDYNFPQIFSFSYIYQLPFGQGMQFAGNAGKVENALIGNWNFSGVISAHSGSPFNVLSGVNTANKGGTLRANVVPGCQLVPSGFQQNTSHWYNPACFTLPPAYTIGNLGRNTLRGPGYTDFDFSLFKDFSFTESKKLEFRTDAFNVFNHGNLYPPGASDSGALGGNVGTSVGTPTYMRILGAYDSREIQFALKLIF